jgi:prophage regulatory protein
MHPPLSGPSPASPSSEDVAGHPSRLRSVAWIAALIGCGEMTVYNKVRREGFPAPIKIGSMTRWREAEVTAWLDQRPRAAIAGVAGDENPPAVEEGI